MENKINLAEILKDCPKGMKLDCIMYEGAELDCVTNDEGYPIKILIKDDIAGNIEISLTKEGCYNKLHNPKCVIFPKGKTTWEGFQKPFKDGDVIYNRGIKAIAIYNKQTDDATISHCFLNTRGEFKIWHRHSKDLSDWMLATEEEKQKLFYAIQYNGYKWNSETRTLEKLIVPKFKVGDRIKWKGHDASGRIEKIENNVYHVDYGYDDGIIRVNLIMQDDYELVPDKFDINTLKPFDKVLVRDKDKHEWGISLFSHCKGLELYKYSCINGCGYAQCIPYEDNKHLLGKKDDCGDYYKNWK